MGGKSSDKSSRQMIQMQKEEAAQARQREAARGGRIASGLERIRQAFEGAPVMGSRAIPTSTMSWSGGADVPAGFTRVALSGGGGGVAQPAAYAAAPAAAAPSHTSFGSYGQSRNTATAYGGSGGNPGQVGSHRSTSGGVPTQQHNSSGQLVSGGAPVQYGIRGPDGRIYRAGEAITTGGGSEQYDTGQRTGGIGEDFYNKFKQGLIDYYNPQVAEQYAKGKDETTFRHARAGTLRSTSAAKNAADLFKQKGIREGEVLSKADEAAGDLRDRVAMERAKAESQLYATENPDVAANQALAAITNISAEQPSLTPLGEIFNIASIGGANYMRGAQTAAARKLLPSSGGYGATSIVRA